MPQSLPQFRRSQFREKWIKPAGFNGRWRWDSDTTSHMQGFLKGFLQGKKKTCFVSETTGLFVFLFFYKGLFSFPQPFHLHYPQVDEAHHTMGMTERTQ